MKTNRRWLGGGVGAILLLSLLPPSASAQFTTAQMNMLRDYFNGSATIPPSLYANLGTPANGTIKYCVDCDTTDPCAGSGTGAFAYRNGGIWSCASTGGGSGVADPGSDGFMVRTALNVSAARTLTSPLGTLAIGNATGVAGNPTLDVDSSIYGQFATGAGTAPATCVQGDFYYETDTFFVTACPVTDTPITLIGKAETSTAGFGFVIDEDSFATDSATKVPTQQSTKAYIAAQIAGVGAGDTVVVKSAIESITSDDTLTADNTLVVAILASTKYMFTFEVFYSSHSDADFKYEVTCPASPTYASGNRNVFTATSDPTAGFLNCATGALALTHTSGTAGGIRLVLYVSNGVNAGNVSFLWAQNTSNGGTTSVLEGSSVKYRVIP